MKMVNRVGANTQPGFTSDVTENGSELSMFCQGSGEHVRKFLRVTLPEPSTWICTGLTASPLGLVKFCLTCWDVGRSGFGA